MVDELENTGLRLLEHNENVLILEFDAPGESVNTLRADFAGHFNRAFDLIERKKGVSALVLASTKEDNFIAGADISMLQKLDRAEEATALCRVGQAAVERIVHCGLPVIAAIHGACLGGGLEIALACSGRVASSDRKTKLGLPEVQLGILPGLGGTQRLPALVGLSTALDLLLTGRQLDASRALKIGLVDEVVPQSVLRQVAIERAVELSRAGAEPGASLRALRELLSTDELRQLAMAENPLGRKVVFDQAKKRLLAKTRGNYPAPMSILDVVKFGLERGQRAGLEREAEAFGQLLVTSEAASLRHIYFSQQSLKKDTGTASEGEGRSLQRVGVLGAGLMGAGVAFVSASTAGTSVRLKDVTEKGVQSGLCTIGRILDKSVESRRITARIREEALGRITCTTDGSSMINCDVVIEAVFEDLGLKQRVLEEFEGNASKESIFASNTSSLPISKIAEGAKHPERVIGMHYFSPVEKMPLLEVVATEKTADWVTQSCVDLGKRQGKTVIVVGDGPGFYTTRVLVPYLNEAAFALMEGASVEAIDGELVDAGFPVGPMALLDEIGIDVGTHVAATLHAALGDRVAAPPQFEQLVQSGRLGRKNRKGFYCYEEKAKGKRPVDTSIYEALGLSKPGSSAPQAAGGINEPNSVAERCLLAMVNEAVHCLDEGVLRNPRDGDVGAIFGLGFPPFLGGPFFWVDAQGAHQVLGRLKRLEREFGARFAPAPKLKQLGESGGAFYA